MLYDTAQPIDTSKTSKQMQDFIKYCKREDIPVHWVVAPSQPFDSQELPDLFANTLIKSLERDIKHKLLTRFISQEYLEVFS
jgi:hypothetical protein